ncbi:TlpA disulfide reductase family protein [Flavivirga sp. 57AJ16]|uniref:TlpA disulfide reductase family protein n=1 Tax=Flavivirga sp. 57AJ16 TaxID=3025307 RepID=UPI002366F71A|nr:TlpA disulfide reductase family protein [Flavivirga sp. 57AJ16]MDD7888138.1 TlpA disulfide reductase family protein [Flavivirga sp. 57AJ16]
MMIKKYIVCVLMLLTMWGCNKKNKDENYSLTVKVNNTNSPKAKMYLFNTLIKLNAQTLLDSASLKNGMFHFKGEVSEPKQVFLILNKEGTGFKDSKNFSGILPMYLEKGNINVAIKDAVKNAVITGSKLNTEYKAYNKLLYPTKFNDEYARLKKAIKDEVSAEKKELLKKEELDIINNRAKYRDSTILEYAKQHPDSYFSLEGLNIFIQKGYDVSVLRAIFENLNEELRTGKRGLEFLKKLNKKRADIGKLALDFTQNDETGKPIKLSDFRGKYLLLDFWASWCGPCRAENPNLIKAYAKYHDKGFDILSVSLDTKKEAWEKAIKQENLPWVHVSDLKGFENKAAVLYDVHAIPKSLLIDPNGKVIAMDLRGYRLEEELYKIFK